jgi:hypothetical protein
MSNYQMQLTCTILKHVEHEHIISSNPYTSIAKFEFLIEFSGTLGVLMLTWTLCMN